MTSSQLSSSPPLPHPPSALPSDIDLIKILLAHIGCSATPASNKTVIIHRADVYSEDPADLTRQFPPAVAEDGQKAWYFITQLLPKSKQRGKQKRRGTVTGVWHNEGKTHPVVTVRGSVKRLIGYRNHFAFMNKVNGKKKDRTGWCMKEFQLEDANEKDLVLCKVYASSRRAPNPAMGNEAADAALAQARVEVEAEAAATREKWLKARETAVAKKEAAVAAREEAVAADLMVLKIHAGTESEAVALADVEETPVIEAGVEALAVCPAVTENVDPKKSYFIWMENIDCTTPGLGSMNFASNMRTPEDLNPFFCGQEDFPNGMTEPEEDRADCWSRMLRPPSEYGGRDGPQDALHLF